MKLFDTLSGEIKPFVPRRAKRVDLFVCGPTVYDAAHIGHARTYIVFDAFGKYLRHEGFGVRYVQNITDVEDKIIARAKEQNISWRELARTWERAYRADMKVLGVTAVTTYARATSRIKEIIAQIEVLLANGYAYQTNDGVYYNVAKFSDYGKLSHRTVQQAEDAVSRIDESSSKKNKGDFALWKLSNTDEPRGRLRPKGFGAPKWKSPWGWGRPGWHIEDTAITEHFFGAQYDVHGGARDLIFPHHEAEIAQMEAASGKKPLVRFWMHTGFLTVKGEKMSKSLGNFITIQDLLAKHTPYDFRLFVLLRQYRSPISYEEKYLAEAHAQRMRLEEFTRKLYERGKRAGGLTPRSGSDPPLADQFWYHLSDDFNTPEAFAALFELLNQTNKTLDENTLPPAEAKKILHFLQEINKTFGILDPAAFRAQKIPAEVQKLVSQRETMREQKQWEKADKLRKKISSTGYEVEDTSLGPRIKKQQTNK